MSSDYTVHQTENIEVIVTEQSMLYDLSISAKDNCLNVALNETMAPTQFKDFIISLARVYSYQHPGLDTKSLAEAINKLA